MKKQTRIAARLCLVVGLAIVSANAQATFVKGKVPFNFTVSGTTLPAGDYTMIVGPHQLKIKDAHGKIVALALANDVSGRFSRKSYQITFRCYHDRCFLAEVWFSPQENGCVLPTSRAEATLAKQESGKYFAVLGGEPLTRQ